MKKDLRAIDSMLSGIDRELLLLKYIKPTNLEEERQRLEQDINYNPIFNYAEPNVDIDDVVKKLEKLRADKSPLGILLEKKRKELLTRISLIRNRGDAHKFTEASRSLYGSPTSALLKSAAAVMQQRVACDLPPPKNKIKNAEEAQKIFDEALNKFGLHDWQSSVRKKIVADCTVGGKNIYIRDDASFSEIEIEALISHEIETHIFCAENGSNQPYSLFRNGCANYLDTQEGLAIYNQNRLYGPYHNKRFNPPSNVLGVAFALDHSFAETRKYLEDELGYPPYKAIASTISMKRGLTDTSEPGGFTKSIVYFRGYRAVLQFIDDGGDLKDLYIGKIAMEDLDNIKKIPELQAPLLLPNFLWKKEEKPKKKSTKNKNTKKQKKNIDSEERKE